MCSRTETDRQVSVDCLVILEDVVLVETGNLFNLIATALLS